jgi:hypothetical protein
MVPGCKKLPYEITPGKWGDQYQNQMIICTFQLSVAGITFNKTYLYKFTHLYNSRFSIAHFLSIKIKETIP